MHNEFMAIIYIGFLLLTVVPPPVRGRGRRALHRRPPAVDAQRGGPHPGRRAPPFAVGGVNGGFEDAGGRQTADGKSGRGHRLVPGQGPAVGAVQLQREDLPNAFVVKENRI